MKRMVWFLLIIFLFSCTTQKGACEDKALGVDDGLSYGGCEDLPFSLWLKNLSVTEYDKQGAQQYADLNLLRCLSYTQAKRECKDKSTIIPALK